MIIISHARSGSTYLGSALANYFSAINLNEFFNCDSYITWGDLYVQRRKLQQGTKTVIHTLVLDVNANLNNKIVTDVLTKVSFEASTHLEIDEFIRIETYKRLDFLDKLQASGKQYVLKYFPAINLHVDIELRELIANKLMNLPGKVLLYRKDLNEVVMSDLIKRIYNTSPPKSGTPGQLEDEVGHNMHNQPAPKISDQLEVFPYHIEGRVITFLQLFVDYSRYSPIESISYEDMFSGGTVLINGIVVSPMEIVRKYPVGEEIEYKMDYSLTGNKMGFFTNPDNVQQLISTIATTKSTAMGIDNTIKKLGIYW